MRRLFLIIIITLLSAPALALWNHIIFSSPPPKILLDKIDKIYDSRAKQNERIFINETFQEYFKKAKPNEIFKIQKFRKSADSLENSDLSQSWRDEAALALDGKPVPKVIYLRGDEDLYKHFYVHSPLATAKIIARAKMYEAIQSNWGKLQTTVFNDAGIDCSNVKNCQAFDEDIMEKMQDGFFFSYPLTKQLGNGNYVFEFQGVGFVEVNKQTLKSGRVTFGISYFNDNNQIEKGAERYRTDVEAGLAPPPRCRRLQLLTVALLLLPISFSLDNFQTF